MTDNKATPELVSLIKRTGSIYKHEALKAQHELCLAMLPSLKMDILEDLDYELVDIDIYGVELKASTEVELKYLKEARWDILGRALQKLSEEIIGLVKEQALHGKLYIADIRIWPVESGHEERVARFEVVVKVA